MQKKRVLDLVDNLQKAFENHIHQLDWMSAITKNKRRRNYMPSQKKIGYPNGSRAYHAKIQKETYVNNVIALDKNAYPYNIAKLHMPPNRAVLGTTPATLIAYYNPPLNEIVFPAGILPFP
jgi:putative endopeptidase